MALRVHLNCACSLDGRIAGPGGRPVRLSSEEDLQRVHRLRAQSDAVLVGVGTARTDDPALRVKPEYADGADPLRVVLDSQGRLPPESRLLQGAGTLVLHGPGVDRDWGDAAHQEVALDRAGRVRLDAAAAALEERGVARLMVEGGARVLRAFLEADRVDAWTLYQAPRILGDGPPLWPGGVPGRPLGVRFEQAEPFGGGVLWTFSRS